MSVSLSLSSDYSNPSFVKEYVDNVTIYWYNEEFAQSRYPPGQKISKACTLICLLVAQRISEAGLSIYDVESTPEITNCIAEAMIEGNATHAWIVKNGFVSHPYLSTEEALKYGGNRLTEAMIEGNATHAWIVKNGFVSHPYLSTEEALKYGGNRLSILKEWTFQVFHERIERGLHQNINNFLHKWYASPKSNNLFMLLITCGRTVLFIFQENTNTVTFFDSHSHQMYARSNKGLVLAQAAIDKLQYLCKWYIGDILNQCYNIKSEQYELAFLYPKDNKCCGCSFSCSCGSFCNKRNQ